MHVKHTICALTLTLAMLATLTAPVLAEELPAAVAPGAGQAATSTHPDVQRALDYTLPQADCPRPQMSRGSNDPTAVDRFKRAMKRYTDCLKAYDETLFNDLTFLHGSVAHGATQAQAEQIGARLLAVGLAINMLKSGGIALSAEQQQRMAAMLPATRAAAPVAPPAAQ